MEIFKPQKYTTMYRAISPDGFDCFMDETYQTKKAAKAAIKRFCERYTKQGHYSSLSFGRLGIETLEDFCEVRKVDGNRNFSS